MSIIFIMKGIGFVLIKCEKEKIKDVYNEVTANGNVEYAYGVDGDYDIIAKIVTSSPSDVPRAVLNLRKIEGIRSTKTLTVVNLEA